MINLTNCTDQKRTVFVDQPLARWKISVEGNNKIRPTNPIGRNCKVSIISMYTMACEGH